MLSGKFHKIEQGRHVEYENCIDEEVIATAEIPHNSPKSDFYYEDSLSGRYEFHYVPTRRFKEYLSDFDRGNDAYEIINQGKFIGYVCSKIRGGLMKKYRFDSIVLHGVEYSVYFIALGKDGKRMMFYKNENGFETQIAEVRKSNEVIDRLDEYFYQIIDERYILPVGLFLLFFDFRKNMRNYGEIAKGSKEILISTTKEKDLLDKYNPEFWEHMDIEK